MLFLKKTPMAIAATFLIGVSFSIAQERPGLDSQNSGVTRTSIPSVDMQVISRSLAMLPGNPPVIESLDIQDYQLDRIREIRQTFQTRMGSAAKSLAKASAADRRIGYERVFDELDQQLSSVLLPNQFTRLKEIAVQSFAVSPDGSIYLPNLLSLSSVQRKLGLTALEMNEMRKNAVAERKRLAKEIARLKKESHERQLDALTPEQRGRLDSIMGEPFDFQGYGPGQGGQFRKADDDH